MPGPEEMKGKALLRMELDTEAIDRSDAHGSDLPGIHRVIIKRGGNGSYEHYFLVDSGSTKKVKIALKNELGAEASASTVSPGEGSKGILPHSETGERSTRSPLQLPSIFDIFTRIP